MIGEHFPKVSPPSRQSLKSYNAKFVMDKCARNKYGVTLSVNVFSTAVLIEDTVNSETNIMNRIETC